MNRRTESRPPTVRAGGGLDFQIIAELDGMFNWNCAFGDTDHDNQREIIAVVELAGTFEIRTRYFEEQANNHYVIVQDVPYYYPFESGDLDGDGLSEVVSQWGPFIRVYESSSPTGHPDHLSWQSPALINVIGYPTIGDTDGDGRQEIIHSVESLWRRFRSVGHFREPRQRQLPARVRSSHELARSPRESGGRHRWRWPS